MSDERRILTAGASALLRGADYIEQHGHAKGSYRIYDHPEKMPRVCALGALRMATDEQPALHEAVERLKTKIGSDQIACWSDASSAANVIATMRDAALSSQPEVGKT